MKGEQKIIGMITELGNRLSGEIKAVDVSLNRKFDALDAKVTGMNADIGGLKSDMAGLKKDVSTLKSDVSVLKSDVATLKSDVSVLKTDVTDLKLSQEGIVETLAGMDTYMHEQLATKADLAKHDVRITRLERLQGIA